MQEWTVTLQLEANTNTKQEDTYLKYARILSSGGNINNFFVMFVYKFRHASIIDKNQHMHFFTFKTALV